MGKLFKKSLAFCVAIAMVFTLFAGAISVNAETEETLTVTLKVTDTEVAEGATEVVLPLDVTCSGDTSINAIRFVITTTAGTVTNVASAAETEDYTLYYNGQYALINVPTSEDGTLGGINDANLLVTVALNEGLDKEAYGITIDCRSENAADANENPLKMSYETGYILLPFNHVHAWSDAYTYDENNHWKTCECGEKAEEVAHVWENDGDAVAPDCVDTLVQNKICNTCGATTTANVEPVGHDYEYTNKGETHDAVCKNNPAHVITGEAHNYVDGECVCGAEEVTECTHAYDAADNVNYVKFIETGIVHYEICTLCGEEVALSTDDSADAAVVAGKSESLVAYSAVYVGDGTEFDIEFALPDGYAESDVKFAYVDGDRIVVISNHKSMNDGNASNGENPFVATYANGVATFSGAPAGTYIACIPQDVAAVNKIASVGITTSYSAESKIALIFLLQNRSTLVYSGNNVFESYYGKVTHHAYTIKDATNTEKEDYATIYIDPKYYVKDNGGMDGFPYYVAPMQMGDNVDCEYYGIRDGIDYLIREKMSHSVIAYAASSVGFDKNDELNSVFLANMLNYATTCQKYFGYRTNHFVDEDDRVSEDIAEYRTQYAATAEGLPTVDTKTYSDAVDGKTLFATQKSFSAESITELDFILHFNTGSNAQFVNVYGVQNIPNVTYKFEVDGVLQDEVITYSEEGSDSFKQYLPAKNQYMLVYNKLTSIEFDKVVTLRGYYNGEEVVYTSNSINNYCRSQWAATTAGYCTGTTSADLAKSLYYYGVSARAHFIRN